MFVGVAKIFCD